MTLISEAQSASFYERKGLAAGEQDEHVDRCSECSEPTLADELAVLDGQDVCLPCLVALTGDDPYAPDNARDLGSVDLVAVLLVSIFGGLAFLAFLAYGQQAMCSLHDQGLRYCPGYEAQR